MKKIRFSLYVDQAWIHNVDELVEHFNLSDLLKHLNDGRLIRWLKCQGEDEKAQKLNQALESGSTEDKCKTILKAFCISIAKHDLEYLIHDVNFEEERKVELSEWQKLDFHVKNVIEGYHNGYEVLKQQLLEKSYERAFVRRGFKEIKNNFMDIFKVDIHNFIALASDQAPLLLLGMLAEEKIRECLTIENDRDILSTIYQIFNNGVIQQEMLKDGTGLGLITGIDEDYWKDIEERKKKCMVVSLSNRCVVRSCSKHKGDMKSEDIKATFPILNGLQLKSRSASNVLIYLEV